MTTLEQGSIYTTPITIIAYKLFDRSSDNRDLVSYEIGPDSLMLILSIKAVPGDSNFGCYVEYNFLHKGGIFVSSFYDNPTALQKVA